MSGRLLVVTIDRLPAWILPAYGSTWVSAAAIDAVAARGIVFDGLVATGTDPRATLAELAGGLRSGPATASRVAVVTDDPALAKVIWPAADVSVVATASPPQMADDEEQTDLARLFDAAAATVAGGRHDLVWCHAASLGLAWDAPAECRDAYVDPDDPAPPAGANVPDLVVTADTDPDLVVGLRHVFAGQVTLLDRRLGRLLDAAADGWAILICGVRGMPLGLHGRLGSGPLPPYGELVRLPAVVVDAAGRMAGQRFGGLAVPADLGVTLAELVWHRAAGAPPEPWEGVSLAGLFADWSSRGRDRVVIESPEGVAIATEAWHLVWAAGPTGEPAVRLFAKPDDAFELCDVADRCAAAVDALRPLAEAAAAGDRATAWSRPLGPAAVESR